MLLVISTELRAIVKHFVDDVGDFNTDGAILRHFVDDIGDFNT